jgi:hypothetical protein
MGQVLRDQGALDAGRLALLEALVREHLRVHGGDAGASLAALSSLDSVRAELERTADPDLRSCLTATAIHGHGPGGGNVASLPGGPKRATPLQPPVPPRVDWTVRSG